MPEGEQGPPDWCADLLMAEAWGVPPWLVEEQASAVWADRFALLAGARAERDKPKQVIGHSQRII